MSTAPPPDARDLPIWTVYDHPSDYPECFVARMFSMRTGQPTARVVTAATLDGIRAALQAQCAFVLERFPRAPGDDPVIVESWL